MNSVESLEAFLGRIEAHLGDLPEARRAEILAEARGHLEAMLAASRADGLDEAATWEKAARGFGDADAIGRELAFEWKRAPRVETVGAPLSPRQKMWLFARPVVNWLVSLALYHIIFGPGVLTSWWAAVTYAVFGLGFLAYGLWRTRVILRKWTPATIFNGINVACLISMSTLHRLLGSELTGAAWTAFLDRGLNAAMLLWLISLVWRFIEQRSKRGLIEPRSKTPWRQMAGYSKNPIATEEIYRLAPQVTMAALLATAVAVAIYLAIYKGWNSLLFVGMAAVISLVFLFKRFMLQKLSR